MSADIESRIRAFESRISSVLEGATEQVMEFRYESDDDLQYLLSERLPALGSIILPELRKILEDEAATVDTRYLAASVAFTLGDRGDSIAVLCDEVDRFEKWALPAAELLAHERIVEGLRPIESALQRVNPADTTATLGYLAALRDLGGQLDPGTRERLRAGAEEWLASAIDRDFGAAG